MLNCNSKEQVTIYDFILTNLDGCSSALSSSTPSEVSERDWLLSLSWPLVLEVVFKPKLASKLPKQNPSFSDSGTWRWFGIITCCWLSEMCETSSFLSSSEVFSFESRVSNACCDWVWVLLASTGTVRTSDELTVPDPWARLGLVGFGFHSLLGATV